MTCSKYPPMLSRLLDCELSAWETAEVEAHTAQCENCRAMMEHWRLQSSHLRNHLAQHRLGNDFVKKVLQTVPLQERGSEESVAVTTGRRGWVRWLQAAAAILIAAVIISQVFSSRDNVGYARVIDPGALEVLQSNAWVRATAGELLHPGDWLRNPVAGAPEILWRNSSRLTLEAGTLAHIPDGKVQPLDYVVLIVGSLLSEVQTGKQDLNVSTPAGTVTAAGGRFSVRVTDFALPKLEIMGDRSEILTGTVVPIGEVNVGDGKATVQVAQASREVRAGETALFSASDISTTAAHTRPVEASLKIVPRAAEKGTLTSSLTATAEDISVNLEAANISLKKLLEWATVSAVRGGDDADVVGSLRFPANSSPEAIASAVGVALGVPISYRQEKTRQAVAAGQVNPAPAPDWVKGDFTFERSQNGLISFDFRAVPAGQAFRILRSAVNDVPELSAEVESLPITLHASGLNPGEVSAWVGKALGLQIKMADRQAGVIEIGTPTTSSMNTGTAALAAPQAFESPAFSTSNGQDANERPSGGDLSPAAVTQPSITNNVSVSALSAQPVPTRSLWSVLDQGMGTAGFYSTAAPAGRNGSSVTGKTTPKKPEFFGLVGMLGKPGPSLHLIWPALGTEGASGGEAAYLITNNVGLPARTLWSGYDRDGQLMAQYEVLADSGSTLAVLPTRDLPTDVGEGGHWETLSNIPLVGSRDSGSGDGLGLPADTARLTRQWSFPSVWLSLGARVWLVNPEEEPATVVVAILQRGKTVATEQLHLQPHGGMLWPDGTSGVGAGMTVAIYVSQGSAATGLK